MVDYQTLESKISGLEPTFSGYITEKSGFENGVKTPSGKHFLIDVYKSEGLILLQDTDNDYNIFLQKDSLELVKNNTNITPIYNAKSRSFLFDDLNTADSREKIEYRKQFMNLDFFVNMDKKYDFTDNAYDFFISSLNIFEMYLPDIPLKRRESGFNTVKDSYRIIMR